MPGSHTRVWPRSHIQGCWGPGARARGARPSPRLSSGPVGPHMNAGLRLRCLHVITQAVYSLIKWGSVRAGVCTVRASGKNSPCARQRRQRGQLSSKRSPDSAGKPSNPLFVTVGGWL